MFNQSGRGLSPLEPAELELETDLTVSDAFFQAAPVPMLLLDMEGRVCRSNRAAQDALGHLGERSQNLGLGIAVRCVHAFQNPACCGSSPACENCSLARLISQTVDTRQTVQRAEVRVALRRGKQIRECFLLVSTALVDVPHEQRVVVCIEDVTARKNAEFRLRNALREVERLKEQLQLENLGLREEVQRSLEADQIVGKSDELKHILDKVRRVAPTDANVLILGETGTGKELVARAIHQHSPRRDRPLVTVNCTALPGNLFESELFGHVAGAYTGALGNKIGRFELANGGTIFLDEIAELHPDLQVKLLRAIQQGQFERVGSSQTRTVDVRVVAATNRDLMTAIEQDAFRSDLYYRLAVFPIEVPPLRERRTDIPLLVWHFVTKAQTRLGKRIDTISDEAMAALVHYDWPGNVRELENVIERAVILSSGSTLHFDEPVVNPLVQRRADSSQKDMKAVERAHILEVLEDCQWKVNGQGNAADCLGMNPSTLRSRMKKLAIERP